MPRSLKPGAYATVWHNLADIISKNLAPKKLEIPYQTKKQAHKNRLTYYAFMRACDRAAKDAFIKNDTTTQEHWQSYANAMRWYTCTVDGNKLILENKNENPDSKILQQALDQALEGVDLLNEQTKGELRLKTGDSWNTAESQRRQEELFAKMGYNPDGTRNKNDKNQGADAEPKEPKEPKEPNPFDSPAYQDDEEPKEPKEPNPKET